MFWRQIPRAREVLSADSQPSSTLHRPSSRADDDEQQPRLAYTSRDGGGRNFDGKKEWRKAIRQVRDEGRHASDGSHDLKHVGDVVEAAVALDRDNKMKLLKGFAVRLRRKSVGGSTKPRLDLEDDSPDPITLARITPFESSPPASLCGRPSRAEEDGNGETDAASSTANPDHSSRQVSSQRLLPAHASRTSVLPSTRPDSCRESSDDESTLPPYESPERFSPTPTRPSPPTRSTTAYRPLTSDQSITSISRPQLDRRATVANPISYISLPPLPSPPPSIFPTSVRTSLRDPVTQERELSGSSDELERSFTRLSRQSSQRNSIASNRRRSHRPFHELYAISGLSNLGNSCYLSAVIQSLAATECLSNFLASGEYEQEVNWNNRNGSQGKIAEALSVLFRAMSSGRHRVITAGRFRDIISSASQFDNYDQQDAHDFLLYLLDALHEDLNLVVHPCPLGENSPHRQAELDELPEVVAADEEWAAYREQNDSIIIDFFQGQLRNRMECLYCGEVSTTYNPLQTLPLPIPEVSDGVPVQLEDCIDEFLREEVLEGDNAWNCPRCRRPRTASKQLAITRLPQILIVQLKRFTSYSSFSSKIDTPVDFPVDKLELGYLLPPKSTSTKYRLNLPHETNTNYELYAVVNHLGGLNSSGHYTAIVRKGSTFLEVDDETITPVPTSEITDRYASSAYLLLYRLTS